MNKVLLFGLLIVLLSSCQKKVEEDHHANYARLISSNEKTGSTYYLSLFMGHSAKDCTGCVLINGHWGHLDCMGSGHACSQSALVIIDDPIGSGYFTATTVDTSDFTCEEAFYMPDRSLSSTYFGMNCYMNIPAQVVERDSVNRRFIIKDITFSVYPIYKNE